MCGLCVMCVYCVSFYLCKKVCMMYGLGEFLIARLVSVCKSVSFLFSMCELLFICDCECCE